MATLSLNKSWASPMWGRSVIRVIECAIGTVMVVSAWLHLQNTMQFYIHVAQYRLVPVSLLPMVSLMIPWLLLLAGMLMITQSCRRASAIIGAFLFLTFAVAQIFAMSTGSKIDCGCFGSMFEREIGWGTVCVPVILFFGCVAVATYDLIVSKYKVTTNAADG